jgi:hypothetical protein
VAWSRGRAPPARLHLRMLNAVQMDEEGWCDGSFVAVGDAEADGSGVGGDGDR